MTVRDLIWEIRAEDEFTCRWAKRVQCDACDPVDCRKGDKEKNAASNEHYTRKDQGIVVYSQSSVLLDLNSGPCYGSDHRNAYESTANSLFL